MSAPSKWKAISTSVYNADCGTGAGGFKKGNTCAGGASKQWTDKLDLAKELGSGPKPSKSQNGRNLFFHVEDLEVLEDKLTKLGFFVLEKGSMNSEAFAIYGHPAGHIVETEPSNSKRMGAKVALKFVEKQHQEGAGLSTEASSTSRKLSSSKVTGAAYDAQVYAVAGEHKKAMEAHEDALHYLSKFTSKKYGKKLQDAIDLHSIAADYHKEKAGLQ